MRRILLEKERLLLEEDDYFVMVDILRAQYCMFLNEFPVHDFDRYTPNRRVVDQPLEVGCSTRPQMGVMGSETVMFLNNVPLLY